MNTLNANKTCRRLLIFLCVALLVCSVEVLAQVTQTFEEVDNWIYQGDSYPLRYNTKRYSKEDVAEAQNKFNVLKAELSNSSSEWHGEYFAAFGFYAVNRVALIWSAQNGFLITNVYTCRPELRGLVSGSVNETPSFVQFTSTYPLNSPRRESEQTKYVKVKWGDQYLLVAENDLVAFGEEAAGLKIEPKPDENDSIALESLSVWEKAEDSEKKRFGLPVLPPEYNHLARRPIEGQIILVGKRTVRKTINQWGTPETESRVVVTLDVGAKDGVRKGMTFGTLDVDGGGVEIISVKQNFSTGVIVRDIDENGKETYYDSEQKQTKLYSKITVDWRVTTAVEPQYVGQR